MNTRSVRAKRYKTLSKEKTNTLKNCLNFKLLKIKQGTWSSLNFKFLYLKQGTLYVLQYFVFVFAIFNFRRKSFSFNDKNGLLKNVH